MAVSIMGVIYNTALTCALTLAIGCAYYLYEKTRKPALLALGIMFCVYLMDNTIVFCTESIPEFSQAYDELFVSIPALKTVYFIVLIGSMLYAFSGVVIPALSLPAAVCLLGSYAALLICIPMISSSRWMVFFYYLPTQLLIMGVSVWGLLTLRKNPGAYPLAQRLPPKRLLVFLLCMSALVLAEDTLVIFLFDLYQEPGLKIHNRNLSENILLLGLAARTVRSAWRSLKAAPQPYDAPSPVLCPERSPMKAFGLAHSLTEREQEILRRVLDGKSQQEISEELTIALGTVKTHIHNIYQKTGVANRGQMIVKYQQFCASTAEEGGPGRPDPLLSSQQQRR